MAAIPVLDRLPAAAAQGDAAAAIARVLQAEGAARAATAECERQAAALVQDARDCTRRIGARAAGRSTRVHDAARAQTAARLAAIEAERARLAAVRSDPQADAPRIRAAVSALATALLGGEP
ncbi:MAG: hypothetical protein ACK5TK_01000 [Betaproteobacteria bacterium]